MITLLWILAGLFLAGFALFCWAMARAAAWASEYGDEFDETKR